MKSDRHDIPDWKLERLAAGDLPKAEADTLRAAVEADPAARERLTALERSNAEILITYPARSVVPEIQRRAGVRPAKARSTWGMVLAPLAVGVAAFAIFVPSTSEGPGVDPSGVDGPDTVRLKGLPLLRIHRQVGARTEKLDPSALVRPGDVLQLAYVAADKNYGVIFSIDGRGGVTLHHPEEPGRAQALQKGAEVALPHAYELDDAPDFERFFFVTSEAPIDLDAVLAGAKLLAKSPEKSSRGYLTLPDGVTQYSFTLRKEAR